MHFLLEAIHVGLAVLIIGTLISMPAFYIKNGRLPTLKDFSLIEAGLFITGFLVHVLCEFIYLNKWYCKHGHACKSEQ